MGIIIGDDLEATIGMLSCIPSNKYPRKSIEQMALRSLSSLKGGCMMSCFIPCLHHGGWDDRIF